MKINWHSGIMVPKVTWVWPTLNVKNDHVLLHFEDIILSRLLEHVTRSRSL